MIYDFDIASKVDNLQQYYTSLRDLHERSHGVDYTLVHNEIKHRFKQCESYTEFGVNQGATLAAAMLENPKVIRGYDIALRPYLYAAHLFSEYAIDNNIDYRIYEKNTLNITIEPVDLLYIDTRHIYSHLKKESELHGDKVKKYIIFHDTYEQKELGRAVREYVDNNSMWSIITECKQNVGFMTIERI
jgi:hypothetical protein